MKDQRSLVYNATSQGEAMSLRGRLEESGIPVEIVAFSDAMSALMYQQPPGTCAIYVSHTDADRAEQIVDEWCKADEQAGAGPAEAAPEPQAPVEPPHLVSKSAQEADKLMGVRGVGRRLLGQPSLVLTICVLASIMGNVVYAVHIGWAFLVLSDPGANGPAMLHKDGKGILLSRNELIPGGGTKVSYFDTKGLPMGESVDADGDGRVDVAVTRGPGEQDPLVALTDNDQDGRFDDQVVAVASQIVERRRDANHDGWFEEAVGVRDDKMLWRVADRNTDGRLDEGTLFDAREQPVATLSDPDGDGFLESVTCTAPNGVVMIRDTRRCLGNPVSAVASPR